MTSKDRIRRSMLWAAYGDALGFITELCDRSTLSYRTGGKSHVSELIPWKRKIGGRYGVFWQLPAGCYSDDTQLRLAVCRSIRGDGQFDVEPFAKVELPVFLAYALGAGTSTKSAAEALKKKTVQWNTNFYETNYAKYINGGGNGAAMRIQPHVWSARPQSSDVDLLLGVLRDAVVTHGHPVAFVGAAFHALFLHDAMNSDQAIPPPLWKDVLARTESIPEIVGSDDDLSLLWLPEWERRTGRPFAEGVHQAIKDAKVDMDHLIAALPKPESARNREEAYAAGVKILDALNKASRGSGIKTALLAAYVSVLFSNEPARGMAACANVIGSDTDTIGTMAGALLGAVADSDPPQRVQDQGYLLHEADRMAALRDGVSPTTHTYPDLLLWNPPASSIDMIGIDGTALILRGFGKVNPLGQSVEQKGRSPAVWQECRTEFGQTLIFKRRKVPKKANEDDLPREMLPKKNHERTTPSGECTPVSERDTSQQLDFLEPRERANSRPLTIDEASDAVIKSGFDPAATGRALMSLAVQENGVEKAIGFAAIVAKAKGYRMRRDQSP